MSHSHTLDTEDPFELLGVEPGVDARTLKRAYARLIKQYRPDRDPEAFQRIRAAYEAIQQATVMSFLAHAVSSPAHLEIERDTRPVEPSVEPAARPQPAPANPVDQQPPDTSIPEPRVRQASVERAESTARRLRARMLDDDYDAVIAILKQPQTAGDALISPALDHVIAASVTALCRYRPKQAKHLQACYPTETIGDPQLRHVCELMRCKAMFSGTFARTDRWSSIDRLFVRMLLFEDDPDTRQSWRALQLDMRSNSREYVTFFKDMARTESELWYLCVELAEAYDLDPLADQADEADETVVAAIREFHHTLVRRRRISRALGLAGWAIVLVAVIFALRHFWPSLPEDWAELVIALTGAILVFAVSFTTVHQWRRNRRQVRRLLGHFFADTGAPPPLVAQWVLDHAEEVPLLSPLHFIIDKHPGFDIVARLARLARQFS